MALEEDHVTVYNEDDEDEEHLNDVVLDDDEDVVVGDRAADADGDDSSDSDDGDTNSTSSAAVPAVPISSSAVSIAVLPPASAGSVNGSDPSPVAVTPALAAATAVIAMAAPNAVATATPMAERKPIDDSRKLFQKMWSDEDEIELLRGFLEYTTQRGLNWSGHHDTTAFYDQIKSKIQLDCNKNQLVEKLRRLKKKYRNVVSRISSGKEFVFRTPHDQAAFEISREIWGNSISQRPEFDDDDQNPNPISGTPVVSTYHGAGDHRTPGGFGIDVNSSDKMMMMMMNMGTPSGSRKRSRVKMEEKSSRNVNSGGYEAANAAPIQGQQEEMVKSCLPSLLKEFIDNAAGGIGFFGGGSKGIESLISNAIPMNFPGASLGSCRDVMHERWRKQQILELEVYSKRLELVQDQIKLALEELRSRGS